MKIQSEDIWLKQLSKGTEEAYKLLFDRYYSLLGVFAYRYLNDKQEAEDAINDVLLGLYQDKEKFETISALKAYLYNSVRNRCLNILRHNKIRSRYREEIAGQTETSFFLNQILESEVYELLEKAIGELPEQTRIVYQLVIQGYNNKEIAAKTGLSEDAIKAYKQRGKKILKERLQHLLILLIIFRFLSHY